MHRRKTSSTFVSVRRRTVYCCESREISNMSLFSEQVPHNGQIACSSLNSVMCLRVHFANCFRLRVLQAFCKAAKATDSATVAAIPTQSCKSKKTVCKQKLTDLWWRLNRHCDTNLSATKQIVCATVDVCLRGSKTTVVLPSGAKSCITCGL